MRKLPVDLGGVYNALLLQLCSPNWSNSWQRCNWQTLHGWIDKIVMFLWCNTKRKKKRSQFFKQLVNAFRNRFSWMLRLTLLVPTTLGTANWFFKYREGWWGEWHYNYWLVKKFEVRFKLSEFRKTEGLPLGPLSHHIAERLFFINIKIGYFLMIGSSVGNLSPYIFGCVFNLPNIFNFLSVSSSFVHTWSRTTVYPCSKYSKNLRLRIGRHFSNLALTGSYINGN